MKIKTILTQHRRDFTATLECEHCQSTQTLNSGYDDHFFHTNVIPKINCNFCGKSAPSDYRPLTTKYHESEIV